MVVSFPVYYSVTWVMYDIHNYSTSVHCDCYYQIPVNCHSEGYEMMLLYWFWTHNHQTLIVGVSFPSTYYVSIVYTRVQV